MKYVMFRQFTAKEAEEAKAWARANYVPLEPISGVWHPIVQRECTLMNEEDHLDPNPRHEA